MNENSKKTEKLKQIRDEVLDMADCSLADIRRESGMKPVIGEGDHDADIVFVGEAPGQNEAIYGRPFCGRAGNLLDELLQSINMERKSIYITNILKDRPPENRDPQPEEIALYGPFLDRQLEIIEPKVIATLGRFAMSYILKHDGLDSKMGITQAHGQIYKLQSLTDNLSIVPLYHPAAAIYRQQLKDTLFEDFKVLQKFIGGE